MEKEWKLPLVNNYIEKWAAQTPDQVAMIQHEEGRSVTYSQFAAMIDLFALRLLAMGIGKGDRVSTMLLMFPEHLVLMYACFKVGAIVAPLDVRLKEKEVVRDLDKIKPKAFFFHGSTPVRDFRQVGLAVKEQCPYVNHLVQLSPASPGEIIEGAVSFTDLFNPSALAELRSNASLSRLLSENYAEHKTRDAALIIFTTGTTGAPKPAVLCHENIIAQNEVLARGIGLVGRDMSMVCNLPASHVAGTSECPMTTFYLGGTAILLRIFTPALTLEAAEKRRATVLGMIPTQYRMLWALPDYNKYDLSSLKFAAYAGASVDVPFLNQLSRMAPAFGTGLGMTENAGFATFTPPGISVEEMAGQVGAFFPDVAAVSVRKPMNADGTAGNELPDGELGEICYHPPIVFLGYYDQPEETARAVSSEGILYTGDMGYFRNMGSYRALYLGGRRKFMVKQKGYNVFPDEVSAYIGEHPKVALAEVVGAPHRLFDEGIFAFVQPKPGMELKVEEITEHCRGIASYKRPQHVEIWPADKPWPLTRMGKVDKVELQSLAVTFTGKLREGGHWDAL
ncbi:MAG: AMP-dependent synthetase [Peptococcaceae bacterium BICA1-7]|nr:MAG: AMP-dependent synthetase [Peptococcaceae bacterium BICA1-7]HBV95512.1 long-chain fatty acid--CoA ligase [Desulfotomaculum sp.]